MTKQSKNPVISDWVCELIAGIEPANLILTKREFLGFVYTKTISIYRTKCYSLAFIVRYYGDLSDACLALGRCDLMGHGGLFLLSYPYMTRMGSSPFPDGNRHFVGNAKHHATPAFSSHCGTCRGLFRLFRNVVATVVCGLLECSLHG